MKSCGIKYGVITSKGLWATARKQAVQALLYGKHKSRFFSAPPMDPARIKHGKGKRKHK